MTIYHFADKELAMVYPSLPKHGYTKFYGIPISYWFDKATNREPRLVTGKFRHLGVISNNALYKLRLNPLHLPFTTPALISESLQFLRKAGYSGVIVRMNRYNIVMLFHKLPVVLFDRPYTKRKKRGQNK